MKFLQKYFNFNQLMNKRWIHKGYLSFGINLSGINIILYNLFGINLFGINLFGTISAWVVSGYFILKPILSTKLVHLILFIIPQKFIPNDIYTK